MSITAHRRSAPKIETATAEKMGPWQATALVIGSIIGVGIFSLPYALASYGPISLVAMGIATVGAIALALMFAVLSRRLPADGRPVRLRPRRVRQRRRASATRGRTGSPPGPATPPSPSAGSTTSRRSSTRAAARRWSILIALVGLWIPAAVNLTGVRNMGVVPGRGRTVLKFIPLALMATVGLFFITAGNFTPWNTSGDTNLLRHRRRDGDLPVQLPRRRDGGRRRRQGAQPGAQRRRSPRSTAPWPAPWSTCSR